MKTKKIISIAGRVVFYVLMLFFAVLIIRSDIHILAQLALIILIATACFTVREWHNAVEIDPEIPMSPEEEIMYREMKDKSERLIEYEKDTAEKD
jgi:hypothetical protein